MNFTSIFAIYKFEMSRTFRTLTQSIAAPVISTILYFIVFGSAIGSRISDIDGISYSSFIVPGLIMLTILSQSISNASFGIYFPRFTGTIYEVLSAPISFYEIALGYVGAATSKSMIIGIIVLLTSSFFVDLEIKHPIWMFFYLFVTCLTFCLIGFIIGIISDGFDKLQLVPLLIITPLTFLGGSFYSISMLPDFWQKISLLNPLLYLISGFRWSFYENSDVNILISFGMIILFLIICISVIYFIFKTGYKLRE